jgi:hypothetical protein
MHTSIRPRPVLLHLVLALCWFRIVVGSLGDRLPSYQACVTDCRDSGCVGVQPAPAKLCETVCLGYTTVWLQLFQWSCEVRHSVIMHMDAVVFEKLTTKGIGVWAQRLKICL